MTNGDKIRNLTDEALASLFFRMMMNRQAVCAFCAFFGTCNDLCSCKYGVIKWLKQSAIERDENSTEDTQQPESQM